MSTLCRCNDGMANMGLVNCENIFKAAKKFGFVSQFSNAGTENCIDPTSTLNLAWINPLINNADKSVRVFMTPQLKNVDLVKADPVMETFEDNSNNFVSENIRTATAVLPEAPPRWKANFETIRCNLNTSTYVVDKEGNLIGCTKYNDGKLYPIPVNAKSVYANVVWAKDATSQQMAIRFEIPNWFDDSTLRMISKDAFTDFNMLSIAGLIDANIKFSNIASGSVDATITTPITSLNEEKAVEGLVIADFVSSVTGATSKIRNVTDGADVTITAVSETAPGVYNITYTLASGKTVVVFADLDGVDFANLKNVSYVTA